MTDQLLNIKKERDLSLDLMKGIGIIAMIIGHLTGFGRQFIFSFHMPLFFIIAGFLFRPQNLASATKKDFHRLIIPYFITAIALLIFYIAAYLIKNDLDISRWFYAPLWGSGAVHNAPIMGDFYSIGAVWFLWALFWCRFIFQIFSNIIKNLILLGAVCLSISLTSILIDNYIISLPLSFLPGSAAIIFYYAGYVIQKLGGFNEIKWYYALCLVLLWIVSTFLPNTPLALVICSYPYYPLSVLGGIGGTLFIWLICNRLTQYRGGG